MTEFPFLNETLPIEDRINDLISRLTLEEKTKQLLHESPAVDSVGLPEYNWWNECLHGVGRAGKATIFPQPIAMAASFDKSLLKEVTTAISDEARAKHHAAIRMGNRGQYNGLTFWSPNINIFRDPRWGRGHETFGEDPYLMAEMGKAYVEGLQGDDPKYMKVAACAKHYAVHSGPEGERHTFNAIANEKDLWETYLPAFEALVKEAKVEAVMGAYNRTNGEPCCGSVTLLQKILRDKWGFEGHVVSDCWALRDFHQHHKITNSAAESAAYALKNGLDLNCGCVYEDLIESINEGLITEEDIDRSLRRLFRTRFKLGMFDSNDSVSYAKIEPSVVCSKKHRALARKMAGESMVLLKNRDNILPLPKDIKRIFMTGPSATTVEVMMGNYFGASANITTILEGVTERISDGATLEFRQGFLFDQDHANPTNWVTYEGQRFDVALIACGLCPMQEGEEGEAILSGFGGDRRTIGLPANQVKAIKDMAATKAKVILLVTGGGPISLAEVADCVDGIIQVWYPGEAGGQAVADVLFGDVNPSGRMPFTVPYSEKDLPAYEDYSMKGRTYRYMEKAVLYPFGFGLSYSNFTYSTFEFSKSEIAEGESFMAKVKVKNDSNRAGHEIIQLYREIDTKEILNQPKWTLIGFEKIWLEAGETKEVSFTVESSKLRVIDESGNSIWMKGDVVLHVAPSLPTERSSELGASGGILKKLKIK